MKIRKRRKALTYRDGHTLAALAAFAKEGGGVKSEDAMNALTISLSIAPERKVRAFARRSGIDARELRAVREAFALLERLGNDEEDDSDGDAL